MSLFDNLFEMPSLETEEERITRMLEWYTLNYVKNIGLEDLKKNTLKTEKQTDNNYIKLYHDLKNLLLYSANLIDKGVYTPIEIVDASYAEILFIINDKIIYNEITLLANTILTLDIESAKAILITIEMVENNKKINIYDKLDYLKLCVSKYKEISPVLYIK